VVGEVLSHYRIVEKLGEGGMGQVFLAQDTSLDRKVAIKILPESFRMDAAARKRFLQEAKLAAALDHPYICSIHELLDVSTQSCIVMEYIDGQTLKERLEGGALPLPDGLRAGMEIAEALEKAHLKGIIHRDLKPANIMITPEGHVKVMDFGLAKQIDGIGTGVDETRSSLTRDGMTVGTLAYMSPEQAQGHALTPESDLFALGVVLWEMLIGVHPFKKGLELETAHAIVHSKPSFPAGFPDDLRRLLSTLLSKQPHERGSAQDARSCLARAMQQSGSDTAIVTGTMISSVRQTLVRPWVAIPALIAIVAASYFGYRRIERDRGVAWARDVALPEISRLTENGEALAAFNLATEAEKYLPKETKALATLRPLFARVATITSDPPGASVSWKDYQAPDSEWKSLGQTPITGMSVPAVFGSVRLEKDGYQPVLRATPLAQDLSVALEKDGSLPPDMVRVPESVFSLALPGLDHLKKQPIGAFLIDKYEVTNRAYKKFVDAGGYRDQRYWQHPFVIDGRTLSWEAGIERFKDRTGRTGPATWEAGDYAEGQDDFPVSGVSWYEASAYAEFVGKSLPTIYHWYTAAGMASSAFIVPLSNLGTSTGPAAVGTFRGFGPFGSYDMAGNVREWCRNGSSRGQHFILGGGWNDPVYAFDSDAYTQPPFDRSASNGFRCIKSVGSAEDDAAAARTIGLSFRDLFKETPSSDQEFGVFLRQYAYDSTPLNVRVIGTENSAEAWTAQKITFDAAYENEHVIAYLFLPKHVAPPYQVVFHWPGDSGLQLRSSDYPQMSRTVDFIVKSGRAALIPVFKGMFERGDGLENTVPNETISYKEHVVMWVKDVRRSIDYLQTRPDVDMSRLAYYGASWGGRLSGLALAVDHRFKAAVLQVAGFRFPRSLPEVDPFNFVPRVKIPVLMLNGRYDHYFPVETAQRPMFMLLGTPPEHKKWIVYDGGHFVPRDQLIKETLVWLDRYLGPVQ
jgi:formylglycine-generating enzyme required for sulfatase activity/dienelactone hydrolase/predicted Ser/Thr protein kinase